MADRDQRPGGRAPGVPDDYYERIAAVEGGHWWHEGMRDLTAELLAARLDSSGQALLDAGCGTGGFLRWAATTGAFDGLAGCDLSSHAIALARERSPALELHVAPLDALPFEDRRFDVLTVNDVLQHLPEDDVGASLRECRRVLRAGGHLLLRTNGARRARRERDDWRVYDRRSLGAEVVSAGFAVERITYAALLPSAWAAARGGSPRAPQAGERGRDGVPEPVSAVRDRAGRLSLAAERRWLARTGRSVGFGHTLVAVARA